MSDTPALTPELIAYLAKVSSALQAIEPSAAFGEGEFYVREVVIGWGCGPDQEIHGRFLPNDFNGYDFQPGYEYLPRKSKQ